MKRLGIVSCFLALAVFSAAPALAQNVSNYADQGGSTWHVAGDLQVESGGSVDIESGGALKIAGTDVTAILATSPAAVAAGYKIARGETALDGSNPTPVTTGLATITGCAVAIKLTTAPGVGTSNITYGSSTGTLNLYGWKVTGTGDATLIASTGTENVGWVCVGT